MRKTVTLTRFSPMFEEVFGRCVNYVGRDLSDIYVNPSTAKRKAFEDVYAEYVSAKNHRCFGICGYNNQQFSVAYYCEIAEQSVIIYITYKTKYMIFI